MRRIVIQCNWYFTSSLHRCNAWVSKLSDIFISGPVATNQSQLIYHSHRPLWRNKVMSVLYVNELAQLPAMWKGHAAEQHNSGNAAWPWNSVSARHCHSDFDVRSFGKAVSSDDGDIDSYVTSQLDEPITNSRLSLHQYACVISCPELPNCLWGNFHGAMLQTPLHNASYK